MVPRPSLANSRRASASVAASPILISSVSRSVTSLSSTSSCCTVTCPVIVNVPSVVPLGTTTFELASVIGQVVVLISSTTSIVQPASLVTIDPAWPNTTWAPLWASFRIHWTPPRRAISSASSMLPLAHLPFAGSRNTCTLLSSASTIAISLWSLLNAMLPREGISPTFSIMAVGVMYPPSSSCQASTEDCWKMWARPWILPGAL